MIEKIQDFIDKLAFGTFVLIPTSTAAFGIFLYLVEFYNFLRYGARDQVTIYDLIHPLTVKNGKSELDEWVGLASIIDNISINIVLITFGLFWLWIIYIYIKSGKDSISK